jgi:inorganic pyrophosphatase
VLAAEAKLEHAQAFVYFPVFVHACDIFVSSLGVLSLGDGSPRSVPNIPLLNLLGYGDVSVAEALADPMRILKRGYTVSITLAGVCMLFLCRWLLFVPSAPWAWANYYACALVGMATSYVFSNATQYYTDYQFEPVKSIAQASTTGHGTNIIQGIAVGMSSTAIPVCMVSFSVLAAYWLGRTSGIGSGHSAGLFGTAVATMGMLSSAGYILAMNNYGPIADNAGGIAEMSEQPEEVRDATDRLDACGNVTKAITKGYSIGSAAMACFLLFGALMDEFTAFSGVDCHKVDIAGAWRRGVGRRCEPCGSLLPPNLSHARFTRIPSLTRPFVYFAAPVPEVMVGGLLGVMMVFYFVGLAVSAVGRCAQEVVKDVRRQFKDDPNIMLKKSKPDYKSCVAIVTKAALIEMRAPAFLATCLPVIVGLTFRFIGSLTGRPLLGAEVLMSFLMFATAAGILMALFLDNVGGAWDNAKKYGALGRRGGRGGGPGASCLQRSMALLRGGPRPPRCAAQPPTPPPPPPLPSPPSRALQGRWATLGARAARRTRQPSRATLWGTPARTLPGPPCTWSSSCSARASWCWRPSLPPGRRPKAGRLRPRPSGGGRQG